MQNKLHKKNNNNNDKVIQTFEALENLTQYIFIKMLVNKTGRRKSYSGKKIGKGIQVASKLLYIYVDE